MWNQTGDSGGSPKQSDPTGFQFSTDAPEFVPNGKTSFQFNPGAEEFNPTSPKGVTDVGRQPDASVNQTYLQPVPVAGPAMMGVYPVMAVPTIRPVAGSGQRPQMYTVAPVSPMGGVTPVGFVAAGMAPYHDGSPMSAPVDSRPRGFGKGGSHRHGGHKDGSSRGGQSYERHRNSNGEGGRGWNQDRGYHHHGSSPSSWQDNNDKHSKWEEEEPKEAEKEEEKDDTKDEDDKGPAKTSWADIIRKNAAKASAEAPTRALPKRVPTKGRPAATPSVAAPKAVSWGPAAKAAMSTDVDAPEESPAAGEKEETAPVAAEPLSLADAVPMWPPVLASDSSTAASSTAASNWAPATEVAPGGGTEQSQRKADASQPTVEEGTKPGQQTPSKAAAEERSQAPAPKPVASSRAARPVTIAVSEEAATSEERASPAEGEQPKQKSWADRLFRNPAASPTAPRAKQRVQPQQASSDVPPSPSKNASAKAAATTTEDSAAPAASDVEKHGEEELEAQKATDNEVALEAVKEVDGPKEPRKADKVAEGTADDGAGKLAKGETKDVEGEPWPSEPDTSLPDREQEEDGADEDEVESQSQSQEAEDGMKGTKLEQDGDTAAGAANPSGKNLTLDAIEDDDDEEDEEGDEEEDEEEDEDEAAGSKQQAAADLEGVKGEEEEEEEDEDDEESRDDQAKTPAEVDPEEDDEDDDEETEEDGHRTVPAEGERHEEQPKECTLPSGGPDSAAGPLVYSVAFLKSMATAPGSQGSCPPSIPANLRISEDADEDREWETKGEGTKRYNMNFLKQFKEKTACQELPANHRIPKDLRAATPQHRGDDDDQTPSNADKTPVAEDEDDWRAQSMKHQAQMKNFRDKDSKGGKHGRAGGRAGRQADKRPPEDLPKLQSSDTSWALKQQATKADSDEMINRKMKAILNKLTVEKFDSLYQQLIECGIKKPEHIANLMHEVCEKATTQHHFIEMYTNLSLRLNSWLSDKNGSGEDEKGVSFKRILLNQCQDSFEKNLKPPEGLQELSGEEQFEAKMKYKTRMLGNMKFVGQLLINKVLSSKIIINCIDELLYHKSEETLETLCSFLVTIGPSFDNNGWKNYDQFVEVFSKIKKLCADKMVSPRIRCLLKDVLDQRDNGWRKGRAHNDPEGPMTMADVKSQWVKDNAEKEKRDPKGARGAPPTPSGGGGGGQQEQSGHDQWEVVGKKPSQLKYSVAAPPLGRSTSAQFPSTPSRDNNSFTALDRRQRPDKTKGHSEWRKAGSDYKLATPTARQDKPSLLTAETKFLAPSSAASSSAGHSASAAVSSGAPSGSAQASDARPQEDEATPADLRKEVFGTVKSLAASHDIDDAVSRIRELKIPSRRQRGAVCDMIAKSAEQREAARECLWKLVQRLCTEEVLQRQCLSDGIDNFLDETFGELRWDVPKLPRILKDELFPVLEAGGALPAKEVARLRTKVDQVQEQADEEEAAED